MRFLLNSLAALVLALAGLPGIAQTQVTYFHVDAQGSPVAATDANGNVRWREDYEPYGARRQYAATAIANRAWFAGATTQDDTLLSYMGERYYDPTIGRFYSVDPVGVVPDSPQLTFSRYAYAANNPLRYTDRSGEFLDTIWDIGNVVWDIGTIAYHAANGNAEGVRSGSINLVADTAATLIPFVPAGTTKVLKVGEKVADAARAGATNAANAAKLSKQLGSQEGMAELLSGGGKAIAGAGTNAPLRDVGRLVSQYGGKAADWAKVTSTAPGHLQTHAYRNVVTGEVVELKSILP